MGGEGVERKGAPELSNVQEGMETRPHRRAEEELVSEEERASGSAPRSSLNKEESRGGRARACSHQALFGNEPVLEKVQRNGLPPKKQLENTPCSEPILQ